MRVSIVLFCLYCMTCFTLLCDRFAPLGSEDHSSLKVAIHNLQFFRASSKHVAGSISSGVCL